MQYAELLTGDTAFSTLRNECEAVFDTDKRLPAKVFRPNFTQYYAFEHGQIFRKEFAAFLAEIARVFVDATVNYMTLAPDPVEYYRKNCGFYGLASFESGNLIENYLGVMTRGGSADSFMARGGDVGVIWGSSLSWGIFCDRISWDVCLMGVSSGLDKSLKNAIGCMDSDRLKAYLLNQYRDKNYIVAEFLKGLYANYSVIQ
jgi:hypothetical protein